MVTRHTGSGASRSERGDAEELDGCPLWQTQFANPADWTPVSSDIPTLLASGALDDRTPTDQARRIAAGLTDAYVYEFPNEGHGGPPMGPSGCHLAILMQFWKDPDRAPDASCIASIPPIRFATSWADVPGAR